jgi:hypothetical protein
VFFGNTAVVVFVSWGVAFITPVCEDGKETERHDTVTLSSSYIEGSYTNEQLANFGVELLGVHARFERWLLGGKPLSFFGSLEDAGLFYAGTIPVVAFAVAYHEIGHASRTMARGGDYVLHTKAGADPNNKRVGRDFFRYFIEKIKEPKGGGSTELVDVGSSIRAGGLIVSCGGVDNEIYAAEKMAEKFHDVGTASMLEMCSYGLAMKEIAAYPIDDKAGNDIGHVLRSYKFLGISVTRDDIKNTKYAFWLSGTTYSSLLGLYHFIRSKHLYHAEPLEFFGFTVPDTFPHLTSRGVSYKVLTRYRANDSLRLILGWERVMAGLTTNEVTLGFSKAFGETWGDISCKVKATFGRGLNLETQASVPVGDFSVNISLCTYATNTLLGERHTSDLRTARSTNFAVSVSYHY